MANQFLDLARKTAKDRDTLAAYNAERKAYAEALQGRVWTALRPFVGLQTTDKGTLQLGTEYPGYGLTTEHYADTHYVVSVTHSREKDVLIVSAYRHTNHRNEDRIVMTEGSDDERVDAALRQVALWVGARLAVQS